MKILHCTSKPFDSSYGGLEIYLKYLLPEQVKRGNEIWIASILYKNVDRDDENIVELPSHDGVRIVEIYLPTKYQFSAEEKYDSLLLKLLRDVFDRIKPDICHCHHGFATQCIRLCKSLNIKTVYTIHCGEIFCLTGLLLKDGHLPCDGICSVEKCLSCCSDFLPMPYLGNLFLKCLPTRIRKYCERKIDDWPFVYYFTPLLRQTRFLADILKHQEILSKADAIIAPSHAVGKLAQRQLISFDNIHVILHGIPDEKPLSYPELDQENTVHFYYVGRICFYKGIHILLEAFSKLTHANWRLHLIGEASLGIEKAYAKKLRQKYSDQRFIWHGKVLHNELSKTIAGCHVMIHPAMVFEIYGLTVAEALSWGRPVIATKCGGPESQITDGKNGWLVERNSSRALKERIETILDNPSCLKDVQKNCFVKPLSCHLDEIQSLYHAILN